MCTQKVTYAALAGSHLFKEVSAPYALEVELCEQRVWAPVHDVLQLTEHFVEYKQPFGPHTVAAHRCIDSL